MYQFIKPEFKTLNDQKNANHLEFEFQPLVQGFGTTLGNSLRRVLLSVLPGTAAFAFKLSNAEQEFQTIAGVHENVLKIGLNIEKIIFQADPVLFENQPFIKLFTKINPNQKVVKAGDIEVIGGLKIINPELVLMNVVEIKKPIELTIFIRQSNGYATFEENQRILSNQSESTIGCVAINSQFSPICLVNFQVKEIRIGDESITEKLQLSILTNGAINAKSCLGQAIKILSNHLNYLGELNDGYTEFKFEEPPVKNPVKEEVLLQELDFSERTINALHNHDIHTLSQLKNLNKKQILEIKNLGQKSLKEIEEKLEKEYNITL